MGKYGRIITAAVQLEMTSATADVNVSRWLPGPALITGLTASTQKDFVTSDEYIAYDIYWSTKRAGTLQSGDTRILPLCFGLVAAGLYVQKEPTFIPVEFYIPVKAWTVLVKWTNNAALTDNFGQLLVHFELIGNEPLPIL